MDMSVTYPTSSAQPSRGYAMHLGLRHLAIRQFTHPGSPPGSSRIRRHALATEEEWTGQLLDYRDRALEYIASSVAYVSEAVPLLDSTEASRLAGVITERVEGLRRIVKNGRTRDRHRTSESYRSPGSFAKRPVDPRQVAIERQILDAAATALDDLDDDLTKFRRWRIGQRHLPTVRAFPVARLQGDDGMNAAA